MSKREIIITADDFGLTEEGNRRIIDAYRNTTITDTSLIATGSPSLFYESVHQLKRNPELDVGVHIVLCSEPHKKLYPLTSPKEIPLLIDKDGAFISNTLTWFRRLSHPSAKTQIQREIELQIRRILDAGIRPSFINGHMYTIMVPQVFELTLKAAKRSGIKWIRISDESPYPQWLIPEEILSLSRMRASGMRLLSKFGRYRNKARQSGLYTTDYFAGTVGTMKISQKKFFEILKKLPPGTTELLAHPGNSEIDYCTFTSSSLRMGMEKFNINLTSFRKLKL